MEFKSVTIKIDKSIFDIYRGVNFAVRDGYFFNLAVNPWKKLKSLEVIAGKGQSPQRGLLKRIDENRELLEALQLHAPNLLKEMPWIGCWIKSNDEFFTEMAVQLCIESPKNLPNYPRDFPESKP